MAMNSPALFTGMGIVSFTRLAAINVSQQSLPEERMTLRIPRHKPLRVGTLHRILKDVAEHQKISREQLIAELFG
jgi:hypothetical protein